MHLDVNFYANAQICKLIQPLLSISTATTIVFNSSDQAKKYKDQFKEKHGVGLGFMSFFTKAVTEALKNPNRNVIRVFLTEDSKNNLNRENPNRGFEENQNFDLQNTCQSDILYDNMK